MAWRTHFTLVAAAIGLVAVLPARARTEAQPAADSVPFVARHPELRAALDRIARGSASWRAARTTLAATGRRAVVLTPDQVVVRDSTTGAAAPFDRSTVAEVSPVADRSGNVSNVLVVVNVERMRELHDRRGSLPGEFHADLDRVLAHEVYGHAVPYLEAGHLSGRCADPEPGQPATQACAIRRENVVRAELRLGRRTDAALGGLILAGMLR